MDDNLHIQIADFGLSRLSEATSTRSGALHLNFAAPELLGFSKDDNDPSDDIPTRTQMSDVYAFGCLYYEVGIHNQPCDALAKLLRSITIACLLLVNKISKSGPSSLKAYFLLD